MQLPSQALMVVPSPQQRPLQLQPHHLLLGLAAALQQLVLSALLPLPQLLPCCCEVVVMLLWSV